MNDRALYEIILASNKEVADKTLDVVAEYISKYIPKIILDLDRDLLRDIINDIRAMKTTKSLDEAYREADEELAEGRELERDWRDSSLKEKGL